VTAPLLLARGMVVELANPSCSGRPLRRLAVVLQAGRWLQHHPTITCCPLTRTLLAAPLLRPALQPSGGNGLPGPVQLMADKLITPARSQVRRVMGTLEGADLARVELALRQWLELP
jgi:mRNA interferase MazF